MPVRCVLRAKRQGGGDGDVDAETERGGKNWDANGGSAGKRAKGRKCVVEPWMHGMAGQQGGEAWDHDPCTYIPDLPEYNTPQYCTFQRRHLLETKLVRDLTNGMNY